MAPEACTWKEKGKQPCVGLAVEPGTFCVAHRDKELFSRVPRSKNKTLLCERCGKEIHPGTIAKRTHYGAIHAEFTCEKKSE